MSRGVRWVFTLNNYTEDDVSRLGRLGGDLDRSGVSYLCYGREVGESGTPHLQGFVILSRRRHLAGVRELISTRGHFEICRGTPQQASDYCKKGGITLSSEISLPRDQRPASPSTVIGSEP